MIKIKIKEDDANVMPFDTKERKKSAYFTRPREVLAEAGVTLSVVLCSSVNLYEFNYLGK